MYRTQILLLKEYHKKGEIQMGKMTMKQLREMLCDELDEITKKGELSAGSLDTVDKLTHSIKSIDTIMAMNENYSEDGYSMNGYNSYNDNNSYARGRGRNARRDSMGRYTSDGYSERRGYSRENRMNRYSMDEARESMAEKLHEMLDDAPNEKIKNAIHRIINQLDED